MTAPASFPPCDPLPLRVLLDEALRYWEPRRLAYNLLLTAVVLAWLVLTWPHFRAALTPQALLLLIVLAVLANVCYCGGQRPARNRTNRNTVVRRAGRGAGSSLVSPRSSPGGPRHRPRSR